MSGAKKLKLLACVPCLIAFCLALYVCVPLFVSQLFLSSAPRYSSGLSDSPWEAKAIAVIQAIRDKEVITIIRSTNIAICLG